ncbi:MAG: NADH-dependent alcohol dehydrogenase, partial [Pseudomonadota bacterium]|nr:NADH-dependent alcohol dehydrogenase [Pseudomonadota bacterium]
MNNFNFYNPTRILFGENKIAEMTNFIPQHARVLVLFGGESARKYGTLKEVITSLGDRYIEEFGGIE